MIAMTAKPTQNLSPTGAAESSYFYIIYQMVALILADWHLMNWPNSIKVPDDLQANPRNTKPATKILYKNQILYRIQQLKQPIQGSCLLMTNFTGGDHVKHHNIIQYHFSLEHFWGQHVHNL